MNQLPTQAELALVKKQVMEENLQMRKRIMSLGGQPRSGGFARKLCIAAGAYGYKDWGMLVAAVNAADPKKRS